MWESVILECSFKFFSGQPQLAHYPFTLILRSPGPSKDTSSSAIQLATLGPLETLTTLRPRLTNHSNITSPRSSLTHQGMYYNGTTWAMTLSTCIPTPTGPWAQQLDTPEPRFSQQCAVSKHRAHCVIAPNTNVQFQP